MVQAGALFTVCKPGMGSIFPMNGHFDTVGFRYTYFSCNIDLQPPCQETTIHLFMFSVSCIDHMHTVCMSYRLCSILVEE